MGFLGYKKIADTLYRMILRRVLYKAIDNPDKEWDDVAMNMCDAVFGYGKAKE